MKKLLVVFLIAFLFSVTAHGQCGKERIKVKDTADVDASKINFRPVRSTVAELNALPVPAGLEPSVESRFPAELKVYVVDAYLLGFKIELGSKKDPGDHDYHIAIMDLKTSDTMIVEMPNGPCMPKTLQAQADAQRASWTARFGKPTAKFKYIGQQKIKVEITGIGFFDLKHEDNRSCLPGEKPTKKAKNGRMVCTGQDGVAKNGFELHRVLSWKEIKK